MQEVQIVRWCDWHLLELGEKVSAKGKPTKLGVDGDQADADLCGSCDERIAGPLRLLMDGLGSRTEKAEVEEEELERTQDPTKQSQCPHCRTWMDVRSRIGHARNKHPETLPGAIIWRYADEVEKVWLCVCGLTFPAVRGRDMHVRRTKEEGCAVPEIDEPVYPARPAPMPGVAGPAG